jgi:FkbM family methyltransferase
VATSDALTDLRTRRARGPAWLRRLLAHPRVVPATALLLRARTVRPATAFVARELLRREGAYGYRERSGGLRVVVRHGSADPVTLGEVFHERDYEPPPELPPLRPLRIVDLGANVGYFGAFALGAWPQARVVAYEPDPSNVAVHERAIALNGLQERWELHRSAASTADGQLRFSVSGDALSHADEAGELVVPSEDVLPVLAGADLLKMDIEGGEWAILGDPRFAADPPEVVVMEHHPQGAPSRDPRAAAVEALAEAGLTATMSIFLRADGYGMLWAWRP